MKKISSFILLALLPLMVNAYDAKINGIYYNFNGNEAEVTYENYLSASYSGVVTIPKFVNYNGKTYRVTSIDDYAFCGCPELTTAVIQFGDSLVYNENLIVNGDFSSGNEGFTSDYEYDSENVESVMEEGHYAVGISPDKYYDSRFVVHGDHTTGTGNMLIANGSRSNLDYVWKQNVFVEKGNTYEFSAWLMNIDIYSIGDYSRFSNEFIEYSINGTSIFGTYDKTENEWERFYGIYTATESGEIEIKIRSLSEIGAGNDFAIDDISFSAVSAYEDVNVSIGSCAFANCPKLRQVFCYSRLVPDTQDNTFEGSNIKNATLHVPVGSVNLYEAVSPWNDFGTILAIDNNIKYIGTVQDMVAFASLVNAGVNDANAMLIANIDLSAISSTWIPIGSIDSPYTGVFDGHGHKLTGFTMEAVIGDRQGLFGNVMDATIQNFSIDGSITYCGGTGVGVVGWSEGSTIRNVHSSLNIVVVEENSHHIGGICGSLRTGSTASGCSFSGTITETVGNLDCFGGIAGYCNDYCLYENCANYGTITFSAPNTFAGGICGYVNNDDFYGIKNCLNVGKVQMNNNGTPDYSGAIIGRLRTHANSVFENNYWLKGSAVQVSGQNVITAVSVTPEQLSSGEICYALNSNQTEINWYQTLGEDNYPVLDKTHKMVVYDALYGYHNPDYIINDEMTSFNVATKGIGGTVTFTHDFSGEWESLYLPIAIDYDVIRDNFELAEIDGVVQNDDNGDGIADITVLSIMGFKGQATEPNTPYLIRAKNAGEQTITFEDIIVYPTEEATFDCSSFSTRYDFTGSYNTLGAESLTNRYVIQNGELVKGAASLAPCRWYMTATARNGASLILPNKIRVMMVEDVIDGVSPLLNSSEEVEQVYNLAGQRIVNRQSLRGVNIIRYPNGNTKKVLLK